MFSLLYILAQKIDWSPWGIIITAIVSLATFIGFIWRIFNSKADKGDLLKLEKDMKAEIKNVESRNNNQHQIIRDEMLNLFQSIESQVSIIGKWVQDKKNK